MQSKLQPSSHVVCLNTPLKACAKNIAIRLKYNYNVKQSTVFITCCLFEHISETTLKEHKIRVKYNCNAKQTTVSVTCCLFEQSLKTMHKEHKIRVKRNCI